MRLSVMRAAICALAFLGVGVRQLPAQDPDCAAAAGRLDAGLRTGAQFAADIQLMASCPNGAATVANVWASAPTSIPDLQVIVDGTLDFHDQRLLSALQAAVQSGQGNAVRIAALGSMLSYVDSALSVYLPALLATSTTPGAISWVSGASILYGEIAPSANARATVLALLEQMTGSAGVPEIQSVASRLQEGAYSVINVNTDGIELAYVSCKRYRVRNPNPVGIALRYEVYGTDDREGFTVGPRAYGSPYSESFITTLECGTTLLYYDDVLVDAVVPVHGCGC